MFGILRQSVAAWGGTRTMRVRRARAVWVLVALVFALGPPLVLVLGGCVSVSVTAREGEARSRAVVTDDEIGTAVYVGDEEIRPYRPQPSLVVPETTVDRARFPAVDVHCHWTLEQDPDELLAAMDERNVRAAVNLSGGWGPELDAMLARFARRAPDRLIVFCNVDFSRVDESGFGAAVTAYLRDARAKGARGLKIYKSLGLRHRDASGGLLRADDPRLDPIWTTCGELGMPVLIHSADPPAFFTPIDGRNERWLQLCRHPDWSFYGSDLPGRADMLAQRDNVMKRHPGTIFIGAHVGSDAGDLAAAGRTLDAHPNFFVDISGRVGELGRQPYSARRFFLAHRDRILFGTDRFPGRPVQPRYRIYYRFLETDDEYFEYYDHPFPPAGDWRIYGLGLPDDVLRKVYYENFDRLMSTARANAGAAAND